MALLEVNRDPDRIHLLEGALEVDESSSCEQAPSRPAVHRGALGRAIGAGLATAMVLAPVLAAAAWRDLSSAGEGDVASHRVSRALAAQFAAGGAPQAAPVAAAPGRKLDAAEDDALSLKASETGEAMSVYDHLWNAADATGLVGQRHASAHLFYHKVLQRKIDAWFLTLTPRAAGDDSYYACTGTSFGYFGLQQVRSYPWFEGKIVFSMWDEGGSKTKVLWCGEGVLCTSFGGEGTGSKTIKDFSTWEMDKPYSFMVRHKRKRFTKRRFYQEGYFYATELGGWILMSKIEALPPVGKSWTIEGMYSFVEQFTSRDFEEARWANYGPSFFHHLGDRSDDWHPVREAMFYEGKAESEVKGNANANISGDAFGLGIGGQVGRYGGSTLVVDPPKEIPNALIDFLFTEKKKKLPNGCKGGTCSSSYGDLLYMYCTSASKIPVVIIAIFMSLVCVAVIVGNTYAHFKKKRRQDPVATPFASMGGSPRSGSPGSPGSPLRR